MAYPAALAGDVAELQDNIKNWKEDEATARTTADEFVAGIKEKGEDPLESDNFDAIDGKYKAADTLLEQITDAEGKLLKLAKRAGGEKNPKRPVQASVEVKSWAERVIASKQYADLVESGVLNMEQTKVSMASVEFASRVEMLASFMAATIDGSPLVPSDRSLVPPVPIPIRQVRLLDLITMAETDSDTIEWTQETTRTDAAAETDYGTALPEATYVWTPQTSSVKRIGHHVTASKGNLADQAQFRSILNNRLTSGVRLRVENQILAGDGVGSNLTGITNTAGIATVAKGADTIPDAIHKGMTVVRIALEDDINAVGVHPNDYQDLVLAKGSDGQYLHHQGWQDGTPRTIWGYPAIVSTVFTEGTAMPANWKGATYWSRLGIQVAASDSHADYFLKGLVAILAETRGAVTVDQPRAFVTVTGI